MKLLALAAVTIVVASSPAQQAWPLADGAVAITHVDVLTMQQPTPLRDHTVVVVDGRIIALGPAAEVAVPPGVEVVDGRGRTLLPGFFDMHVHFSEGESDRQLWMYLAAGVTSVQSMHGSPRHLELRRRVAAGEIAGPRILTTGPTTATERVDSPKRARAVVAAQKAAGYDGIKMYGDGSDTMDRETYSTLVAAAHDCGLRVVGHAPRNMPFAAVLGAGQDSIDHMEEIYYTADEVRAGFGSLVDFQFGRKSQSDVSDDLARIGVLRKQLDLAGLARDVQRSGLAVSPTLVAFETICKHTTSAYDDLLTDARLRYMSPLLRRQWGPALNRYRRMWSSRREVMSAVLGVALDVQKDLVAAFDAAGVALMTSSDAPLTFVFPGWSLHRELELFVDCGLSPYAALRAATVTPAKFVGWQDRVGTIAIGREADLIVVDGDPLADVRNAARVQAVIVRGRLLDRAALDRGLADLAAGYELGQVQLAAIAARLDAGDFEAAAEAFAALEAPDASVASYVENTTNERGYELLRGGKIDEAIAMFDLNVESFPRSANAWDSLAEAWMTKGNGQRAIEFYRRALEFDPGNTNATEQIARIRSGK